MSRAVDRVRLRNALNRGDLAILGTATPVDFGPALPGLYTDAGTIRAVQAALVARGFSVGKAGIDGKFGKDTEAALFAFSGKHGPPDEATLAALGVVPGGGGQTPVVTITKTQAAPAAGTSSSGQGVLSRSVAWAGDKPLWQVLLLGAGTAAVAAGAGFLLFGGPKPRRRSSRRRRYA